MEKRYQVFVSSTFVGLQEERAIIFKTLMEMGHLPAGMELFPAMDEEQMEFIKKIIDESDYYLLIIGGRYGSLSTAGLGFTEMEFDYAVGKGLKVLALVHDKPNEIPAGYTELDPDRRQKLEVFRAKVQNGRLVKYWNQAEQLAALVAVSLPAVIRAHPAEGWVRGAAAASVEILSEINALRKENDFLKERLENFMAREFSIKGIVDGLEDFRETIEFKSKRRAIAGEIDGESVRTCILATTWERRFLSMSSELWNGHLESLIAILVINRAVTPAYPRFTANITSIEQGFLEQLKIQLRAWDLIEISQLVGGDKLWRLTTQGEKMHLLHHALKSPKAG